MDKNLKNNHHSSCKKLAKEQALVNRRLNIINIRKYRYLYKHREAYRKPFVGYFNVFEKSLFVTIWSCPIGTDSKKNLHYLIFIRAVTQGQLPRSIRSSCSLSVSVLCPMGQTRYPGNDEPTQTSCLQRLNRSRQMGCSRSTTRFHL